MSAIVQAFLEAMREEEVRERIENESLGDIESDLDSQDYSGLHYLHFQGGDTSWR
jgi:hypothetical protein